MSCGAAVAAKPPEATVPPAPPPAMQPPPLLRRREPDFMGLIGFALFLFILGVVFAVNPRLGSEWVSWVQGMGATVPVLRPPEGLIASAILFFNLAGLSGLAVAGLRVLSGRWRLRSLGDAFGAIGSFVFAYLLTFYRARALTGQQILAIMAGVFGLLLLTYLVIGITWGIGRWSRQVEMERPAIRP